MICLEYLGMERNYPLRNIHRFSRAAPNSVFAILSAGSNVSDSQKISVAKDDIRRGIVCSDELFKRRNKEILSLL